MTSSEVSRLVRDLVQVTHNDSCTTGNDTSELVSNIRGRITVVSSISVYTSKPNLWSQLTRLVVVNADTNIMRYGHLKPVSPDVNIRISRAQPNTAGKVQSICVPVGAYSRSWWIISMVIPLMTLCTTQENTPSSLSTYSLRGPLTGSAKTKVRRLSKSNDRVRLILNSENKKCL